MRLVLTNELLDFQRQVRAHVAAHRPDLPRLPGTRSPESKDMPAYRKWCGSLFSAGLMGSDWPVEWGGAGSTDSLRDFVLDEELAAARVPRAIGAWNLVSAALFTHGSEHQKRTYLPRIRSFEDLWCQLFSEPEAGSDLASLRATAKRTDDGWVINGQKVWTTHAHVADIGFLLARTDPAAPKHQGISAFVVHMQSPGITVRPLRDITGASDFNEVFFDDVLLPVDAIIGEPGQGWEITRSALARERSHSVREDPVVAKIARLVAFAAETADTTGSTLLDRHDVRQRLGYLYARAHATDILGFEGVLREMACSERIFDAPVVKLMFSETNLEAVDYAVELLGEPAVLGEEDPLAPDDGYWQKALLFARGYTISAGSSEILRTLVAERGLGLPR
ncbi:acyl-CoA dehydrogenase family protein [Mycobacterium sp. 236(2023)]|uniref:acyl-CoA dehydrogenase family protein n=1 Tax=Mycobacterium sp. 236(2023) TaxID=3038163 RepID=UPI002414FEA6|nr:acyl-CoA dehydrogenase family protein [Mycobacterium sp. 236(2023)]MDG4668049.1 acyl-CoA dehydrogenase family protein [Mycobacterium sp. 236(2023)]